MELPGLDSFNLVVRHGGFGAASRACGQPKATLSRRVRDLEESLGVRLIERGGRSLRLTDEGAVLHAQTASPVEAINDALNDIRAGLGRPSGRLRISAPILFAHTALGVLAAKFIAAYPDVILEISAEDRFVDLVADDLDVVIRANPRPDDTLVGRCFMRNRLELVAPPDLPRPTHTEGNSERLTFPAVMRMGTGDDDVWTIIDADDGLPRHYHPKAVLRLSSPLTIRNAVLAGAGAALVPRTVVAEDLASGRLVSWGTASGPEIEVWVLHASRRLVSPKVTAFVNFVCDHFNAPSR